MIAVNWLLFLIPLLVSHARSQSALDGFAVSLGAGQAVTARITFDRNKAAAGGMIFSAKRMTPDDENAIRMSQAALIGSGGLLSAGALAARRHSVPAVVLTSARWDKGVLSVDLSALGPTRRGPGGFSYRAVENSMIRSIKEEEVVTVDPVRGRLLLYPPAEQQFELELAQALQAYDGLRNAQALLQWLEARNGENGAAAAALGVRLIDELARRAARGAARAEDLAKVRRAVAALTPANLREELRGRENIIYQQSLEAALSRLQELQRSLGRAGTFSAAERLQFQAEEERDRLRSVARVFSASSGLKAAEDSYRAFSRQAAAKARLLRERKSGSWIDAAAAAGASVAARAEIEGRFYRRFISDNNLGPALEEISSDASLALPRKSQRIRGLIAAAKLEPDSSLGRDILGLLPAAQVFTVASDQEERRDIPRAAVLSAIKELWGESWSPQALGRRKRSGLLLADPKLLVSAVEPAEISGVIFSRDPVSGRAERMAVAATWGLGEGPSSLPLADQYVLDSASGREILPALIADKKEKIEIDGDRAPRRAVVAPGLSMSRCLSPDQLLSLGRIARALDDHFGIGLEIGFALADSRFSVLWTRPMATPPYPPR